MSEITAVTPRAPGAACPQGPLPGHSHASADPACACGHDHDHHHAHNHGHAHPDEEVLGAPDCGCATCACGHDHGGHGDAAHERRELLLMGISALLFAVGMLADDRLSAVLPRWLVLGLCYALPYALCGYAVLQDGLRSILNKDFFNEFTLMGGATIAAIALGQLPEAVGVMLFYRVGEFVQERAAGRSRRSVQALLAARPSVAHELLDGGATRDVAPDALGPGSRILVRPGEKIPLDGQVLEGRSQVDASPLTGESVPQQVSPGGRVLAGTINLNGALRVEVTAPFAESSIARILEMVENAVARKAPTERFITRMARWYTPAVTGLALLVAVVPPLTGLGSFSQWIYRALVLLVISCPCALLISIPLGYFGGIGAASRRGILIKGGAVLDNLRDIRVAALDKTGTLTEGVFEVNAVLPAPGVDAKDLLAAAALAESRSNHPIARSVLRAAQAADQAPDEAAVADMTEVPGKGVQAATADGDTLLAGNAALLQGHGIAPQPVDMPGSVVQVARNGQLLGALVVSDRLKPQAAEAVEALRRLGVRTMAMLTGDREEQARPVAARLRLDVLKAGLLPETKASALEELGPVKHTLFVGDGINDAPVLATAGVGVAMGGLGAEAAIETADVVILDDNPARLPELLRIARRTRTIVWQNIVMALGIKSLFMALGIVGLSGLWEAVFADVGVALMAVLNAARAGKIDA
ncbi:heavy metal translocating P-type ATPase [Desulfovibrio legallii]|uniref:P-type Zn(2+) transporter n=1 Tax=Desulfovibrio legallii TaxID=571438 RepID=A0A1G7R3A7_9BACT|nr:heavy metal translocating P-type ATPase [Desulfovibrio legallii]SDG05208.1 Cd2+/Zn2+-exporting ATPase [Desulfovibrio legallii]